MRVYELYHKMSSEGREVCLNCPLIECVHMPKADPDSVCPLDGTVAQQRIDIHYQMRSERLIEINNLLPTVQFPTIAKVAKLIDVPRGTLDTWRSKGYIETKAVPRDKGSKRCYQLIVGVNDV